MQQSLILTVSQLNTYSKSLLEQDENLNNVFVSGEISNFVDHYRSGHLYMSIKDSNCSIRAVMFAGNANRLKYKPKNGMSVIIRGRVSIYDRDGQYQLYIDDMQPDGAGSLAIAFEQLKEKLNKEGLFSQEHKIPLPQFPDKIGVISSPTGAAVQDVLNVLQRRYPVAEVVFAGVHVQGEKASKQIIDAINKFNELNNVDVIIIARGGGSAEDLWQFNDENLAKTIYKSKIPIISGVGHEIDYTICDFVSDMRAPTPSAAAEIAVPDKNEQIFYVNSLKNTILNYLQNKIYDYERDLKYIEKSPYLQNPEIILNEMQLYIDSLQDKVNDICKNNLYDSEKKFIALCSSLEGLNPLKVLTRGYSVVKNQNKIIIDKNDLSVNDTIDITFSNGNIKAIVTEV